MGDSDDNDELLLMDLGLRPGAPRCASRSGYKRKLLSTSGTQVTQITS